jgi:hypothetical protein
MLEECLLAPLRLSQTKPEALSVTAAPSKRKTTKQSIVARSLRSGLTLKRLQTHPYFEDYNYRMEQIIEPIILEWEAFTSKGL